MVNAESEGVAKAYDELRKKHAAAAAEEEKINEEKQKQKDTDAEKANKYLAQQNQNNHHHHHSPVGGPAEAHLPAATLSAKFDIDRPEGPDNIRINFRMPNAMMISSVFPRNWLVWVICVNKTKVQDLYEYINYRTGGDLMGMFDLLSNHPDTRLYPPCDVPLMHTPLVTGQMLFVRIKKIFFY